MTEQSSSSRIGIAEPATATAVPEMGNPLLTRLRLLCGLDAADLEAVDRLCGERRQLSARETVLPHGRTADRVFVVLAGWACSYRMLPDRRRQITALMMPGDICNLDALHLRWTGQAIATLAPTDIAAIDPNALRDLARERLPVRDALSWLGAVDQRMLTERNACLGRRSAREHVAHLFCELLIRLTLVGEAQGSSYTLPLSQEELADVLGLTPVHVNRVVQKLRSDGLIRYVGKDLTILDWRGLCETAQFRTDYLHLEGIDGTGVDLGPVPWN